jgi:hypothetical protein
MVWDPAEVIPMIEAGKTAAAIAEAFGLNRNQVIGRLHRDQRLVDVWTRIASKRTFKKSKKVAKPVAPSIETPIEETSAPVEEKPRLVRPKPLKLPIGDLAAHQCRWPVDQDQDGIHLFCGAATDPFDRYCPYHLSKAYQRRPG